METVAEILKRSGFTQAQIDAIDAKAMSGFTTVLTEAQQSATKAEEERKTAERERVAAIQAKEAAELAQRSNIAFYENDIIPGLTGWEIEKKELETKAANEAALAAFYKAQNEGARTAGFIPKEAPVFTPPAQTVQPPRDTSGRYVASAPGATPGSPTYIDPNQIASRIGDAAGTLTDIQWKYQSLYGKPLPTPPSELVRQADAQKLSPMDYAARTFNFAAREKELADQAAKERDAGIAAAAVAEKQKAWDDEKAKMIAEQAAKDRLRAEQGGSNPDVRVPPGSSRFTEVRKAVKEGTLPDPLTLTDAQRRAATRQQIHNEISERETAVA